MDFRQLEEKGLFEFISIPILKEAGVVESFNLVMEHVESLETKKLVIDSFHSAKGRVQEPA